MFVLEYRAANIIIIVRRKVIFSVFFNGNGCDLARAMQATASMISASVSSCWLIKSTRQQASATQVYLDVAQRAQQAKTPWLLTDYTDDTDLADVQSCGATIISKYAAMMSWVS